MICRLGNRSMYLGILFPWPLTHPHVWAKGGLVSELLWRLSRLYCTRNTINSVVVFILKKFLGHRLSWISFQNKNSYRIHIKVCWSYLVSRRNSENSSNTHPTPMHTRIHLNTSTHTCTHPGPLPVYNPITDMYRYRPIIGFADIGKCLSVSVIGIGYRYRPIQNAISASLPIYSLAPKWGK